MKNPLRNLKFLLKRRIKVLPVSKSYLYSAVRHFTILRDGLFTPTMEA
jgi:hypothetical protein